VIAAGERWQDDQSLRPSFEDLIGAGAIISYLSGNLYPEAAGAVAAFREARPRLEEYLRQCGSGKELIERGFAEDVSLASELDASDSAPLLIDAAVVRAEGRDRIIWSAAEIAGEVLRWRTWRPRSISLPRNAARDRMSRGTR
jgi:2-phosphosulfolactate phosphatase